LDSLEDFRKNPHVQIPHKSPPTNFQRLGIFKNQIVIRKRNFPHFRPNQPNSQPAHPAFRPSHGPFFFFSTGHPPPLGLSLSAGPAHPHGPTGRLLPPPAPEPSAQDAATGQPRAAPRSTPMTSTRRKIMAASILLHSPIKRLHSPSPITDNRRVQSRAIKAPSTPAIEGARPPPPRLHPTKGRPTLGEDSHTSNAPSLSPQHALTIALPSRGSTASETPLHRLTSLDNPVIELACPSFPSPALLSELSGTGAAGGRAPVSSRAWQWSPVHGGPDRCGPRTRGLGPRVFL
jgi:hypothetical protein